MQSTTIPNKTIVESHLAEEYEGKVFEHIWLTSVNDQVYVHKDFYAILGGQVFYLLHKDRTVSGDSLLQTVTQCVCVGDYNPETWYQSVMRKYERSTFKILTNIQSV